MRPPHITCARSACSISLAVSSPAATSNSPRRGMQQFYQTGSGDRDVLRKIDVLDRVEQLDALLERALERLAAGDEAHAACTLVDHGGRDRIAKIVLTRSATAVDEADAAHVAVRD